MDIIFLTYDGVTYSVDGINTIEKANAYLASKEGASTQTFWENK